MKPLFSLKNHFGNSPIYCNKNRCLNWVDSYDKKVYHWQESHSDPVFYNLNTKATSIGLTSNPDILFMTMEQNAGYFDKRNGKYESIFPKLPHLKDGYILNNGNIHPDGYSYYVGSVNESGLKNKGQIFDIHKDKSVIIRNLKTESINGICWDKNKNLFFSKYTEKKIYRVNVDGIIDILKHEPDGFPSGSCIDEEDRMYNAEDNSSKISIYNLSSLTKEKDIILDFLRPIGLTWGGDDMNILFCTSARDNKGNGGEVYYEKIDNVRGKSTSRLKLSYFLV